MYLLNMLELFLVIILGVFQLLKLGPPVSCKCIHIYTKELIDMDFWRVKRICCVNTKVSRVDTNFVKALSYSQCHWRCKVNVSHQRNIITAKVKYKKLQTYTFLTLIHVQIKIKISKTSSLFLDKGVLNFKTSISFSFSLHSYSYQISTFICYSHNLSRKPALSFIPCQQLIIITQQQ